MARSLPQLLLGGVALLGAGIGVGLWLGGSGGSERVVAASGRDDRALEQALVELAEDVRALRDDLTALAIARTVTADDEASPAVTGELRRELDGLRVAIEGGPARLDGADRRPVGPEREASRDLLERMERLEELLQSRVVMLQRAPLAEALVVPSGPPDRASIAALHHEKESRRSHDEITRRHRFWTYQQVLDRYGAPDEVNPEGDYVEWVYRLPEIGDDFDFHFVDGVCVLAH